LLVSGHPSAHPMERYTHATSIFGAAELMILNRASLAPEIRLAVPRLPDPFRNWVAPGAAGSQRPPAHCRSRRWWWPTGGRAPAQHLGLPRLFFSVARFERDRAGSSAVARAVRTRMPLVPSSNEKHS
jgi:hypothetical protein